MSSRGAKGFGACIRKLREGRGIGLREFARKLGMSPTYLSKIERDELPPPAEDKVIAIARALDQDPDEMLGLAKRVASDVLEIVQRKPRMASFLRSNKGLTAEQLEEVSKFAEKVRDKG